MGLPVPPCKAKHTHTPHNLWTKKPLLLPNMPLLLTPARLMNIHIYVDFIHLNIKILSSSNFLIVSRKHLNKFLLIVNIYHSQLYSRLNDWWAFFNFVYTDQIYNLIVVAQWHLPLSLLRYNCLAFNVISFFVRVVSFFSYQCSIAWHFMSFLSFVRIVSDCRVGFS